MQGVAEVVKRKLAGRWDDTATEKASGAPLPDRFLAWKETALLTCLRFMRSK